MMIDKTKNDNLNQSKLKPKLKQPKYELKTLMISPLANITYLLFDHQTRTCALFDSPWDIPMVLETVEQKGYRLTAVIMTHTHSDHIRDLSPLFKLHEEKNQKLDIYISKAEAEFWGSEFENLPSNAVHFVKDGKKFRFGQTKITPIFAPGHTPGSVCYLLKKDMIVGDVLFTYGCGRVDLWGCGRCKEKNQWSLSSNCGRCDKKSGDVKLLYQSLQKLKAEVPDEVNVRCGHLYGEVEYVTMLEQKQNNPYLLAADFDEFYQLRMQS